MAVAVAVAGATSGLAARAAGLATPTTPTGRFALAVLGVASPAARAASPRWHRPPPPPPPPTDPAPPGHTLRPGRIRRLTAGFTVDKFIPFRGVLTAHATTATEVRRSRLPGEHPHAMRAVRRRRCRLRVARTGSDASCRAMLAEPTELPGRAIVVDPKPDRCVRPCGASASRPLTSWLIRRPGQSAGTASGHGNGGAAGPACGESVSHPGPRPRRWLRDRTARRRLATRCRRQSSGGTAAAQQGSSGLATAAPSIAEDRSAGGERLGEPRWSWDGIHDDRRCQRYGAAVEAPRTRRDW